MAMSSHWIGKIDLLVEQMLRAARVPGAGLAVVAEGKTALAKGFGYRDLHAKLPMTAATVYPIASTTKGINATLLGMLVDEGRLAWDTPVQTYLPRFRLKDPLISPQVTVRDLITMRTGLPPHDWVFIENPISRAELVECLRHLDLSAGLRERYQYNNLTVTLAGHVAEVITGRSWDELVREKILEPLEMRSTVFRMPPGGNVTLSYHENSRRELLESKRLEADVTAPSGGAIHSTVEDMARWALFNLNGGCVATRSLIDPKTLAELQSPQMLIAGGPSARKLNASYAMGWTLDTYNGFSRISHGGYLHDITTEILLFPREGIGIVAFMNFGPPRLALTLGEHVFDLITGGSPVHSIARKLEEYERNVESVRLRDASLQRSESAPPSHALADYAGMYVHPGYGRIDVLLSEGALVFRRGYLSLPLEHWHYDAWVVAENNLFEIDQPHAFDRANRFLFETDAEGRIAALSVRLEPSAALIRFEKGRG